MAGTISTDDALTGNEAVELGIAGDADFRLRLCGQVQGAYSTGRTGLGTEIAVIHAVAAGKIHMRLAHLHDAIFHDSRRQDLAGTTADAEMTGRAALGKLSQ
mgnify:CR=1 FL=1